MRNNPSGRDNGNGSFIFFRRRSRFDQLFVLCRLELQSRARGLMAHERAGHTVQPTDLLHEAYWKLARARNLSVNDRNHFMGLMVMRMKGFLRDYASKRNRRYRAQENASLPQTGRSPSDRTLDRIDIVLPARFVDALERLETTCNLGERLARYVELVILVGMSRREAAEYLGVSTKTLQRDWHFAKSWLVNELGDSPDDDGFQQVLDAMDDVDEDPSSDPPTAEGDGEPVH